MLLEKSTQLIELSQKQINLQTYATNLDGFKSRQEQIEQAVAIILPLVQCLRAFRKKGITNLDLTRQEQIEQAVAIILPLVQCLRAFRKKEFQFGFNSKG